MTILNKIWHQPYTETLISRVSGDAEVVRAGYHLFLKNGLLSHPTHPWTVVASSNRTVADTNDNWSTTSDITYGKNDTWPGSWMLLKSPTGVRGPFYMLLDRTNISSIVTRVVISKSTVDLENLSPVRQPTFLGPYCVFSGSLWDTGWSGHYISSISLVVADDGSFVMGAPRRAGQSLSRSYSESNDDTYFFFNVLEDVNPLDPYGFVLWSAGTASNCQNSVTDAQWATAVSIHPDGTQVTCAILHPIITRASYFDQLPYISYEDALRAYKPFAWPMHITAITSGKEFVKGVISDIYWGGTFRPQNAQPGYDGLNMVAMRKNLLWVPCLTPYRW